MPQSVDLADLPPLSESLLDQFRGGLCVDYTGVDPEALPERLHAVYARVGALLTAPGFGWNTAYEIEKLMARLRLGDTLDLEIARQLDMLQDLVPRSHAVLSDQAAALEDLPDPQKGYDDPQVLRRQALLERVLDDLHWGYGQRFLKRDRIDRYTGNATLWSVLVGLFFIVALVGTQVFGLSLRPYSGLELAAMAGLVGSSFSVLTSPAPDPRTNTLDEIRRLTKGRVLAMRLLTGGLGAVILYFFFEAGLIEGLLFPDLERIGFAGVPSGAGLVAQVGAALDVLAGGEGAAPEGLRDLVEALGDETRRGALRDSLAEIMGADRNGPIGDAPRRVVGDLVPNSELSKLLVWSFVAGFSEKLVKSVLGRVEGDATGA